MQKKNNGCLIYDTIVNERITNKKMLAILIDPDKVTLDSLPFLIEKIQKSPATHIFIGGSLVTNYIIDEIICLLKQTLPIPVVIFPGDPSQISKQADALLFLNLISGRNPDYLIEQQVSAAGVLKQMKIEIIPTGYILIDGGKETAVQRISKTLPLAKNNIDLIIHTALAGQWMGNKLIYLEAGSGALEAVPAEIIKQVKQNINIPLIVGGGIKNNTQIQQAYQNGADMVVIGTAFENDSSFFEK